MVEVHQGRHQQERFRTDGRYVWRHYDRTCGQQRVGIPGSAWRPRLGRLWLIIAWGKGSMRDSQGSQNLWTRIREALDSEGVDAEDRIRGR